MLRWGECFGKEIGKTSGFFFLWPTIPPLIPYQCNLTSEAIEVCDEFVIIICEIFDMNKILQSSQASDLIILCHVHNL